MNKLGIISLVIFILANLTSCAREESDYYLFVENTSSHEDVQKNIYRISPDGEQVEHIYDLGGRNLYWFSLDFRYLALVDNIANEDEPKFVLTVIDMQSNEVIAQIPDLTPYRDQMSVVWDPTSSKILYNRTTSYTPGTRDWGIYDIRDESLTLFPSDNLKDFPAWSTDGKQIAYVSFICPANDDSCHIEPDYSNITITNLDATQIKNVTDFANDSISIELGSGDELFCDLQWSPDDQYIAFQNQCQRNGSILEKHRVFIVNIKDMTVLEVAKFEKPYAYAYHYNWSETNELLVGYTIFNFYNFLRGGVIRFDPLQTIDTRSAELFGFRGSEVNWSTDGSTFIGFTEELIFEVPQNGQLRASGATLLGEFLDGDLTISPESNNLPHGLCQGNVAYWSPDGQYVAYSSTGQQQVCNQDVMNLDVFVYSMEDKQLNNLTESFEGLSEPLGWATTK